MHISLPVLTVNGYLVEYINTTAYYWHVNRPNGIRSCWYCLASLTRSNSPGVGAAWLRSTIPWSHGAILQAFNMFLTKFSAWCLRCSINGMSTGPRTFVPASNGFRPVQGPHYKTVLSYSDTVGCQLNTKVNGINNIKQFS